MTTMLTVHVGLHKTGSTSIQLALSRSTIRDRVILPRDGRRLDSDSVARDLESLPSSGLFSDENILGSPFDGYADLPQRVEAIRTGLGGRPARVVVYVRPQLEWLQSLYTQCIQQGDFRSPEEFVDRVSASPWIDWIQLFAVLKEGAGAEELIVRPYHSHMDVVESFFSLLCLPVGRYSPRRMGRVNRSMAPERAVIMRALTERGLLDQDAVIFARNYLQSQPATVREPLSLFSAELQLALQHKYQGAWSRLKTYIEIGEEGRQAFEAVDWSDSWKVRPWVGEFGESTSVDSALLDVCASLITLQSGGNQAPTSKSRGPVVRALRRLELRARRA